MYTFCNKHVWIAEGVQLQLTKAITFRGKDSKIPLDFAKRDDFLVLFMSTVHGVHSITKKDLELSNFSPTSKITRITQLSNCEKGVVLIGKFFYFVESISIHDEVDNNSSLRYKDYDKPGEQFLPFEAPHNVIIKL